MNYIKQLSNNNNLNSNNKLNDESSGHDSIIYTKDANYKAEIKNDKTNQNKDKDKDITMKDFVVNTFESCTSSEFRAGLGIEQSFISQDNKDIENLNVDIKTDNNI